jgi:hypothetical protein
MTKDAETEVEVDLRAVEVEALSMVGERRMMVFQ